MGIPLPQYTCYMYIYMYVHVLHVYILLYCTCTCTCSIQQVYIERKKHPYDCFTNL